MVQKNLNEERIPRKHFSVLSEDKDVCINIIRIKHHRRSVRLKGYDYSKEGLYFITICTKNRGCLFGEVINGQMKLNEAGIMIEKEWLKLTERFKNIHLHQYIVMPNHFHAILEITVGATLVVAQNTPQSPITQNDQSHMDPPIPHYPK